MSDLARTDTAGGSQRAFFTCGPAASGTSGDTGSVGRSGRRVRASGAARGNAHAWGDAPEPKRSDTVDSDVHRRTRQTDLLALAASQDNLTLEAGYTRPREGTRRSRTGLAYSTLVSVLLDVALSVSP